MWVQAWVKWTKKKCSSILNPSCLGQSPKSSSKALFRLGFFLIMTSIVVLRSSILSIKSDAQKQMNWFGFGRRFQTLTMLKLDFF